MSHNDDVTRAIEKHIDNEVAKVRRLIIRNLAYVGESCITVARTKGSYTDRTGNLRSSVGYVIVEDGDIIQMAGFDGKGSIGKKEGRAFAEELARIYNEGIVLIIVAGMNYASYVAAKGFDVLDSAELQADKLVPQMLDRLGFK